MLTVPLPAQCAGGIFQLIEGGLHVGARRRTPCPPEGTQVVDGDAAQPVPKGTGPAIVDEGRQLANDDGEYLLHQVVDIIVLAYLPANPGANQRRVQFDEALPAHLIALLLHAL
jgi:hypothetical protein